MEYRTTTVLRQGRIAPQTGLAFELKKGQYLKVIDPQGQQVSDLMAFNLHDKAEWLSSGRTLDYASKWLITQGDTLYSNRSNAMFTIEEDTCGVHDFTLTPCSLTMFHRLYKVQGHHPSCHENLCSNLEPWGIGPDDIPTTFNIFMNVPLKPDGSLSVDPPLTQAGDYVLLRAHMDMVVGLTACSAGQSNGGTFKPIDYVCYTAN